MPKTSNWTAKYWLETSRQVNMAPFAERKFLSSKEITRSRGYSEHCKMGKLTEKTSGAKTVNGAPKTVASSLIARP